MTGGGTYLVGEKGPELFTPGASGAITSNSMLAQLSRGVPQANSAPVISIGYSPVYTVTGSGPELDQLRAAMANDRATFANRAKAAVQDGLRRGQVVPGRG